MKSDSFVSVVLVVDNQTEQLLTLLDELCPYLDQHLNDYEIVIIDQNSSDGIETKLLQPLTQHQSIRHIRLSHEESMDVALAAGLENAIGDFVINLNIQSDHPHLIMPLLTQGEQGSDITVCVSSKVTSFLYKKVKKLSKGILKSIGYTLPSNITGTFCFSRKAVNALTECSRFYCKLHMRIANLGLDLFPFESDKHTHDLKKKNIINGIRETLHHMIFNSTKPLRWMSFLGIAGSTTAMTFSLYSLIVHLINDSVAPGWTTTILFISILFSIMFIMLSFFGEYLARLLDNQSDHREYHVSYERNSSVMLNENRSNVLFSSIDDIINENQTEQTP